MDQLLLQHWWLGPTVWVLSYCADYYLTLWGATLRSRCDPHSDARYSYELTPQYRGDIDARKLLSKRFLKALLIGTVLLLVYAKVAQLLDVPSLYLLTVGLLVLIEVPIIIRHLRNIALFRFSLAHGGWKPQEISLPAVLWASAAELLAFGVLFAACAALVPSWLALGGAARCVTLGAQHGTWARAQQRAADEAAAASTRQQAA